MKWKIGKLGVDRAGPETLCLKIGKEKAIVSTGDLAAMVEDELPEDEGNEFGLRTETKSLSKGKMRVIIEAQKDMKKGEPVCFLLDVAKYLDSKGMPTGIRTSDSGILLP